jgi:hypothetical protein
MAHKGAQTNVVIKFLSVLTTHTGVNCNQPEPARDWRSDCLERQYLLVVEFCGVLGRLYSIEGLAQSNNNAKLNYSAKHDQMLLETSAKVEGKTSGQTLGGGFDGWGEVRCEWELGVPRGSRSRGKARCV